MTTIVLYGLRESLRRRMFAVVLVLTLCFLALYAWGAHEAFKDTRNFVGPAEARLNPDQLAGAIVFGLAMFATLFLGAVLAVFLTLNVVRGDTEAGLLQPLVVRPIGRTQLLLARFGGAAGVCVAYVLAVYFASLGITYWAGGWTPDRVVSPGIELAASIVVVSAFALAGSVFLSPIANGIATLMVFGAGLMAGLLGEIGSAIHSHKLQHISRIAWWFVPFDALYEDALHRLTVDTTGFAKFVLQLGPFGGSHQAGTPLLVWAVAYLLLVLGAAVAAFSVRDL
ncbi:MAG: type transport system permease protein [Gaiellaceae bacterium]|nr:type transport system permease protein [Gaiellaceae bacterium]